MSDRVHEAEDTGKDKKKVRLRLLTPERTVYEDDVDYLVVRTTEGELGVLPGHESYCASLAYGMLRTFKGKEENRVFALLGGFATITAHEVVVLSPVADTPDRIEKLLEEKEKAREDNKISEKTANLEIQRAETALRHMLVNMDVSAYSVLKGQMESNNNDGR